LHLEILESRVVPSFLAPRNYDAGSQPVSVAVGDFTGTHVQDLAVADYRRAGTVSVLLGNGDGTFQPARSYPVGNNPRQVAVGDFTGNGILDIVVVDDGGIGGVADIKLLLGNGDGTFQPARTISTAAEGVVGFSVAVGDFTGNGILDLAVTDIPRNAVAVLLGNGDGSFQRAVDYPVGNQPTSVAVADFKNDGTADLVVANRLSNNVSVLLGNGDGTFQPARNFAAERNPLSVTVGDFTGNGRFDIAVSNSGSDTVSVLLSNGDGSFQRPRNYSVGPGPWGIATGDFIGDGIQDLAVANYTSHTVSVLLGTGDGSFVPFQTLEVGGARDVVVGDFTGAGMRDLAVAFEGAGADGLDNSSVSVLLGNGTGRFQAAPSYAVGLDPNSVAVGDFTGSNIQDLVVANSFSNTISVLLGNGDGSFRPARSIATELFPLSVAVGDFTGSRISDLVVANGNNNSVSVLLGNGDGTFQPRVTYAAGSLPWFVTAADLTGNGILDLVVANFLSNDVSVLLGNGDGTFQPARTFAAGMRPVSVAVGDFSGNGIRDLAVADQGDNVTGAGSGVSILRGIGDGTFQAARRLDAGTNPSSVVVGDFTGDGTLSIAVADRATYHETSGVSVLLGNGDGTFQRARTYVTGTHPVALAVGYFTGAGTLDLALAGSGGTRVLLGNGDGTFLDPHVGYVTGYSRALAVGDFNGDGRPDLALAVRGADSVFILINDGIWDSRPGAIGAGRARSVPPKLRTAPALPSLLSANVKGVEPSAALPLPRGTVTFHAAHCAPPAASTSASAEKLTSHTPALARAQAKRTAPWLGDRLFAESAAEPDA
jgi:hypothetical protein